MGRAKRNLNKRIAKAPKEWTIQKNVTALYESIGCEVYNTSQHHNRNTMTPGIPDLIVFFPAKASFWFHEVKRPDGIKGDEEHWRRPPSSKLSEAQHHFLDLCGAVGVARVVGGEEAALSYLSERGYISVDSTAD